jgi:cysteine desulfurase
MDANATEPVRPEARHAMLEALALEGNPASIHGAGRAARRLLEQARAAVASRAGAAPADVVFCSGGTEANAMAISALSPGRRVMIGATEHDAVRAAAPGAEVLPVLADGGIDLDSLRAALTRTPNAVVCLMLANNETGVLHPVAEAARLCRAHGAILHVDAVQAFGRMRVDRDELGADTMAVSAHKMGGPKGAGALILAPGLHLAPLIAGGGQERGRRGGTPALPAIAGFAAAAALPPPEHLAALRDELEASAISAGGVICGGGPGTPRLGNTTCIALPGVRAETQVIAMDLAGIAVSAGAACSSGRITESHVLAAMGLGALAGCAIRVSLPWNADPAGVAAFSRAYAGMARRLAA